MVVGLEFVLSGINQEPGCGGTNMAIGLANYIGCLYGNVVRHDSNANSRDGTAVQGSGKRKLFRDRGMGRRREFYSCRANREVVTCSK